MIEVIRTIDRLRARLAQPLPGDRQTRLSVGFVPTMGSLHEGHLALMRQARAQCQTVVASVFVNPSQFNDPADLAAYPRDEKRDVELAESVGVDVVFAPSADVIYPAGFVTTVSVRGLTERWEGASRGASHFHGVTTVVAKLLNIVRPDVAYFGKKDVQQALIVKRMVLDLNFPVGIDVRPTVREPDGLALSSRNVRLHGVDRQRALALRKGILSARDVLTSRERDFRQAEAAGRQTMIDCGVPPEYFAVVAPDTLEPMVSSAAGDEALIIVAAPVGPVRLIDNESVVLS